MRAWFLVLLLVAPVFAGCLGGPDDAEEVRPQSKARADVSEDFGGVEGIVTDNAVQPVAGATVTLVGADLVATTEADGSFAFSNLDPGEYTIEVRKEGFVPAADVAVVRANAVATVDFLLVHLASQSAYVQQVELAGFMECGVGLGYNVSVLPIPDPPVGPGTSAGLITYTICATPNSVIGFENTTNDRFSHVFEVDAPIHTLVMETVWEPSTGALSDNLWVSLDPQGFPCGSIDPCDWTLLDHWGSSPLQGRVDRAKFEAVQANFTDRCEGGDDGFCGYSFFDEGWPLLARVFARWECQDAGPQACAILQQEFRHLASAFMNEAAPVGYSALA